MKIIFYGKLADVLKHELEMKIEQTCTIAEVRERIAAAFPVAAPLLQDGRVRACIANEIVADDHRVAPTDDVEFLAPVSGG